MSAVVKTKQAQSLDEVPGIDGYDFNEREPLSQEYRDAVYPEHVKAAIAAKAADKGSKP
jgi:hypothetical protein